jgi:hypothetical protein
MQVHPHLHGLKDDGFLGKRYTIFFLQVPNIEDSGKNGISKRIHSYTIQFLFVEGEDDSASSRQRIIVTHYFGHPGDVLQACF